MHIRSKYFYIFFALSLFNHFLFSQEEQFHGQASAWISGDAQREQIGIRYLPELSFILPFTDEVNGNVTVAANSSTSAELFNHHSPLTAGRITPYRIWGRLATEQFEARIGLQKINFGSALLFRPLMWFDAVDARDPLQLTNGVYALLLRYYFQENTNIWLWGLFGNNERKGIDISPTANDRPEFGGRIQTPLWSGEIAATVHHRMVDLTPILQSNGSVKEDRYALDGKWDAGVGLWFESVLVRRDIATASLRYQRLLMAGTDYTFGIGNGLNVVGEFFRTDSPVSIFGTAAGTDLSAFSLNYPLSLMDKLTGFFYRDWTHKEWYRIISFQRTYDNWMMVFLGYWNPSTALIVQSASSQSGNFSYSGKGIQVMVIFNH